ncbi:hypothetical protein DM860_002648 [Cuscuta australis]|uniref:BAR domain-containing protein n=1 Tax=Cuscuta australis TaxID=267555 RepID=A0A328D132_9ASTE|nr:hypothetical protein DM860_002648 [Cuscuta australis]
MKTPLKTLRAALRHEKRERKIRSLTQEDELAQATQDMVDMRDCYDRLLSAAAATVNSVYEFSESLREMGDCLLEKTSLSDDEETGKVLLMLGKVQLQLPKLVNSYRSHINKTITVPSESLLCELQTVEDMKRQCDEKREIYDQLTQKYTDKGKLRGSKGECFSSQQLKAAYDEYDEGANVFVFRMNSLRQGQSRSLLTQAARHHAAQMSFFKRALKYLEEIDPHVKLVTEKQHIDYHFSGLEDDVRDDAVKDDSDEYFDDDHDSNDESESHDGELSFDHVQNENEYVSVNSMELDNTDVTFPQVAKANFSEEIAETNICRKSFALRKETRVSSKSAPLIAESKHERALQKGTSPAYKIHSYVLPTPAETNKTQFPLKSSVEAPPQPRRTSLESRDSLWHSSPLDKNMYEKARRSENLSFRGPFISSLSGHSSPQLDTSSASDAKKAKRQAFSGPLTGKPWPNNSRISSSGPLLFKGIPPQFSGPLLRPLPQPSTSKLSSSQASPPRLSSPKISELHELPRPPPPHLSTTTSIPLSPHITHSGPLLSRLSPANKADVVTHPVAVSTLPMPPPGLPRSYSIPSRGCVGTTSVPKPLTDFTLTPITSSSNSIKTSSPDT